MHYKDIIFIKGKNIECRLIFTFICTDKSAIKFDNFKEIIDEETTVNDCRKKCLEKINSSKCRNIKRILLNVQNMEIKFKQIFNSMKLFEFIDINEEFNQIFITVKKDGLFQSVKEEDKHYEDIMNKFNLESTIGDIRNKLGYDLIIKSTYNEVVLYDDIPLFSIPGKIYTEILDKKSILGYININFLDKYFNCDYFDYVDFDMESTIFNLKQTIIKFFQHEIAILNDLELLIEPKSYIKKKMKMVFHKIILILTTITNTTFYLIRKNCVR